MADTQGPSIPVALEQSEISTNLNANILYTFLMGIYTAVYFGTLYLYMTRKAHRRGVIIAIISSLYVLSVAQLACQWWLLVWQFVQNGTTQDSVFNSLFDPPNWIITATPVFMYLVIILADLLLVWRCFHVWSSSLRVIALPIALLLSEIGKSADKIYRKITEAVLSPEKVNSARQSHIINSLLSATLFTSTSTSIITTLLIMYRIHSVTQMNVSSGRQFRHILDIVVQSSALYSFSLLVYGIDTAVPSSASALDTRVFALTTWGTVLVLTISGMAPIIMVARVALLEHRKDQPSTLPHLSNLRFEGQSSTNTITPGGMAENVIIINSASVDDKFVEP
ncbi:hypothetical protein CVT26_001899 [Gymnopilus dilepis]|uniref:Uncharacterized protein n=1 Tax=Gymnopilus dilepis TaxID=231916 RepID=A0A409Y3Y3_9AGAR|nr:hypothetical protein CVT26_001899 [Gymnopilus dilepis]